MNQQEMFANALWLDGGVEDAEESKIWILRGRFTVGQVKKAVLRVLGLGFFHCYINGKRVGEDLFLPLSTDYEPRKDYPIGEVLAGHRIYVPEFDAAPYLQPGENVIAIHFGGGWYANVQDVKYGDAKAIWRIFGEDERGRFDFVSSEADRISESFVCGYAFTTREEQDYRRENVAALAAEFDESAWPQAQPARPLDTEYAFTDCPADKVRETLSLRCIGRAGGLKIYDCGRNISGYPVLRLQGKRDEEIQVFFSEELTPEGLPDETYGHRQRMRFFCDGAEREAHPLFTWFGFRYFAVQGAAEPLRVDVVHSDVKVTATFTSDNDLLNWIHDAYVNTQLTNMHAGIPSDCPHIERRGYTGDGQLACHAALNILDGKAFYRKWIRDILDSQDTLTGHIQYTAPYIRSGGGPGGWGCAVVEVPYQYYLHYGDVDVLRECYPAMLRYFDYLESHSYGKLVVSDKEGEWCLGDWCPPISVVMPPPFVNNYFYIRSLQRCIEIAGLIGREEDIPEFERRIEERREAVHAAYYHIGDGNYLGNQQGANAFALEMGLGDGRTYPNMVAYYKKIRRYDTGIFGTDLVTRVLFERGDGQTAVDLLLSEAETSFAAMRRAGATTLWEYYPGSLNDRSHNHPMFGAVTSCLYDYLLGIRAEKGSPAYRELRIEPVLVQGINRLAGSRTLPQGKVSVSYEKEENKVRFTLCIPEGQQAKFVYGGREYPLAAGENRFAFDRL